MWQDVLYRRVTEEVQLSESTLNGWFSAGCNLIEPLFEKHKKIVQGVSYLMADETPIPVLTKDKPGATHKGYLWAYYSPVERLVLFDYQKTRSRERTFRVFERLSRNIADGWI